MIAPEDLKIETLRADYRGGQHVGCGPTAVRVTHLPTGIIASVTMRSQIAARDVAINMIECALTHPRYR